MFLLLQSYALDFKTLAIIEAIVFAVLEYKRYENIKKTGVVCFFSSASRLLVLPGLFLMALSAECSFGSVA